MQRIRAYEADGTAHLVPAQTAEAKVLKLAEVLYAAEVAADVAAPPSGPAAPFPDPQTAGLDTAYAKGVELLLRARAELEPLLDIISYLEKGEYVSLTEVQRPAAPAEALLADLAVRHQSKLGEVRDAAALLRRASVAAADGAAHSTRFFAELAELQRCSPARLLGASEASAAAGAPFLFDVSFPGIAPTPPPAQVQLAVGPSPTTGAACLPGGGPAQEGVPALAALLRAKHRRHFTRLLQQQLRTEVGCLAGEEDAATYARLEVELSAALELRRAEEGEATQPLGRPARAWLRLAELLFADVLALAAQGEPVPPQSRVLPRLLPLLRHAAASRAAHAQLARACDALRCGGGRLGMGLPATLRQHATGDASISAWEVTTGLSGLPPVTVVLRGTEAHVEGGRVCPELDMAPGGAVHAPPAWLAFWLADALAKHALQALHCLARQRAGAQTTLMRRTLLVTTRQGGQLKLTANATRAGAVEWSVTRAKGGATQQEVDLEELPGSDAIEKLTQLISSH